MEQEKELGQVAFEAYCSQVGGITFDNRPIPTWENLSESVQNGWRAAAYMAANIQLQRATSILTIAFEELSGLPQDFKNVFKGL